MLEHNYPNPFNSQTKISFFLPKREQVIFTIHDILGRKIHEQEYDELGAGPHTITWDTKKNDALVISTGLYFYKFVVAGKIYTNKMLLLK